MMEVIVDSAEVQAASKQFCSEVRRLANGGEKQVQWNFPDPNNKRSTLETYLLCGPTYDIYVSFGIREDRYTHYFHIANRGEALPSIIAPNVEINVSKVWNRRTAGIFVSADGQLWLCHRGRVNVHRNPIEIETALSFFEQFRVSVIGEERDVIPVVAIGSKTFIADLEAFIVRVIDLKERYKTGTLEDAAVMVESTKTTAFEKEKIDWPWNDGEEFEGFKTTGDRSGNIYEYRHGALCNRLTDTLKKWAKPSYSVRQTKNIDSALVKPDGVARVIFEVKTSASLSDQIYKAVGQLFHYRMKRGNSETLLALALPGEDRPIAGHAVTYVRELGFHIFFEDDHGYFNTPEGASLESILDDELAEGVAVQFDPELI